MSTRLEQRVLAKTASYTILGTIDSPGTRFTNRGAGGAVTFTLPTPSLNVKGHWYEFEVHADQTVIVAGHTTGKLATVGNAAADNVSYAVASNKVGRKIFASCDGTQWFAWGIGEGFCVNGTQIAPTVAELAAFIGLSVSATELGYIDGITAIGTVQASKAVVVDSNKDATGFRNVGVTNLDAGASGAAGSVDIFPATASKGKVTMTATDQVGDTTVGMNFAAMAAARALTVPDPLADADVLLGKQAAVARTASADGTGTGTIAAAGRLQHVTVTSGNNDHIIVLPTPTPGTIVVLYNANIYELRSSAPATVAINGGAAADAESAIPADSCVVAICVSATAWRAFFMDADGDVAKVEAAAAV